VILAVCIGILMGLKSDSEKYEKQKQKEEIDWCNNKISRCYKCLKIFFILAIFIEILHSFIPTTKEMAAIYIIPKVANSQFVNETFPNELKEIYGMSKDWMKDYLKTNKKEIETAVVETVTNNVEAVRKHR
jgi:ABC-type dipeptide/oligopeptide/nickel transport system permease component